MARSLIPFMFDTGFPTARSLADPFLQLHREMNRLFDDALRGFESTGGSGLAAMGAPRMNVSETDGEIQVEAELPGVAEQDVRVELTEDVLTIRGEKKATHENKNVHMIERSFGSFSRSIRLPYPVNPEQVHAEFDHGVLTVTLPKSAEQEKVHRIQVVSGAGHRMVEGMSQSATLPVESPQAGASGSGAKHASESATRKGVAEGMEKAGGKAA